MNEFLLQRTVFILHHFIFFYFFSSRQPPLPLCMHYHLSLLSATTFNPTTNPSLFFSFFPFFFLFFFFFFSLISFGFCSFLYPKCTYHLVCFVTSHFVFYLLLVNIVLCVSYLEEKYCNRRPFQCLFVFNYTYNDIADRFV